MPAIDEYIAEVLFRVRAGDASAEDEIVRLNGGLVRQIARRFPASEAMGLDDLCQESYLVVIRCARSYEPGSGVPWSTYLGACLYRNLRHLVKATPSVVRHQRDSGLSYLSWLERISGVAGPDLHSQPLRTDMLAGLVERLLPSERRVIRCRWRLDSPGDIAQETRSLNEVARLLGMSKRRIIELINSAYDRLRVMLVEIEAAGSGQ